MERPRTRSRRLPPYSVHPIPTPVAGISPNTGPLATAAWLLARGLMPNARNWFVEVDFASGASKFEIEIFSEEWGFAFHHDARASWIRVTDIPFAHGRDEHELLRETSSLSQIGRVLRTVEQRYNLTFSRDAAIIRTDVPDGEPAIREWVVTL